MKFLDEDTFYISPKNFFNGPKIKFSELDKEFVEFGIEYFEKKLSLLKEEYTNL